jgi:hypothetical protein
MKSKFKLTYIPKPRIKQDVKTCISCKKTFPLTHKYFYTKFKKAGTITNKGNKPLTKDCSYFRAICKHCNYEKEKINRKKKLMIKYNVSTDEELSLAIGKAKSNTRRRKYDYPVDATPNEISQLRHLLNKGYDPITYQEEWKKKWLQWQKSRRKYEYPEEYDKVPTSLIQKQVSLNLTDAFIASRLGFKVSEVPQDIIELKRKQLKLYRDVKNKKDQNRNSCGS